MASEKVRKVSYKDLEEFTSDFSESNFIGDFQFGKVYRGEIKRAMETQYVTVKVWDDNSIYNCYPSDNEQRIMDELILLRHEKLNSHPGMVQLCAYCFEGGKIGVVYDLKPLDSLHNLFTNDTFTWPWRIRAALLLAHLIKFLHSGNSFYEPFLLRNLSAAHVMLDKDYNPKLIDFSMISGGILPDRTKYRLQYVLGCYGYIDPWSPFINGVEWYLESDVFAFGVILLCLITKRVRTEEDRLSGVPTIYQWAWDEYESRRSGSVIKLPKFSLVHESFKADPLFYPLDGPKITKLAMQCVDEEAYRRPSMKQVIKSLLKLQIFRDHAQLMSVENGNEPLSQHL